MSFDAWLYRKGSAIAYAKVIVDSLGMTLEFHPDSFKNIKNTRSQNFEQRFMYRGMLILFSVSKIMKFRFLCCDFPNKYRNQNFDSDKIQRLEILKGSFDSKDFDVRCAVCEENGTLRLVYCFIYHKSLFFYYESEQPVLRRLK